MFTDCRNIPSDIFCPAALKSDKPVHYGPRNISTERPARRRVAFKLQCIAIAIFSTYY